MNLTLSSEDVEALIKGAKIGRERKEAQIDTCGVFAAALHDVLASHGREPRIVCAVHRGATASSSWAHAVVALEDRMFDSLGEFDVEILRKRLKIHPSVTYDLSFSPEPRDGCFEEEYEELYDFLRSALQREAIRLLKSSVASP